MYTSNLLSINEAAGSIGVSVDLVQKFIKMGLITPVRDVKSPKLTKYNLRRLMRIVDLYEKSYTADSIEKILNYS